MMGSRKVYWISLSYVLYTYSLCICFLQTLPFSENVSGKKSEIYFNALRRQNYEHVDQTTQQVRGELIRSEDCTAAISESSHTNDARAKAQRKAHKEESSQTGHCAQIQRATAEQQH